jgi:hypothetical protein
MTKRLSIWLVQVLAVGVFAAGCGSSSSTSSTQASSTQTSPSRSTPTAPRLSPADAARVAASCKQKVQAQPTLSASQRAKLEQLCGLTATGTDRAAIRKATEEACIELLNASHVPAGVARERALAVCHGH